MTIDIKDTRAGDAGAANIVLSNFAVAAVAGDFIVAAVAMFGGTKTANLPTDTLGSTFEVIGTQSGGANTQIKMFLAKNIGAGTDAVTFVRGAWSNAAGVAWLIRGGSVNPYNLDFATLFNTSVSATAGPTTVSAIFPGSIFLTMVTVAGTADVGDPTGYNTEGSNGFTAAMHGDLRSKRLNWSTNEDILSAYKIANAPENPTFPNSTGNQQWASVIASFSPPRVANAVSAAPGTIATIGGDTVTITGTNFGSWVTGVTIGGVAATNVLVVDSTHITCTAPAHAVGAVDVVVTAAEGNSTISGGVTYAVKPVPTSVTPQFVILPASGTATIKGSGFESGATVDFGGTPATGVVVVDANTITCDIPSHAAGQVVITVTNP